MTLPKQTLRVVDPGIGFSPAVPGTPLVTGICYGGSLAVNTLGTIGAPDQVRPMLGYGPLAEMVALLLQLVGGPVSVIRHNSATSAALSAVPLTGGTGPAITVAGTPADNYNLRVNITLGGALGTARFRYALDAFDSKIADPTWSQERVVPIGGTFAAPNSGLTFTFPSGTYVLNDTYVLDDTAKPQLVGTADLATVAAIPQANTLLDFHLWGIAGAQTSATQGAAVAAALSGYLTSLTNTYRYARAVLDVGSFDTAPNVVTQSAGWTSTRVSPGFGLVLRPSAQPYEGFSLRRCSMAEGEFIRLVGTLISTDLARFAEGPDSGVRKIEFDSTLDNTIDNASVSSMRSWPGAAGFYFANGKLKAPFGSDFTDTQYGRIMDVACRTTYVAQQPFIAEGFRANADGTIVNSDAVFVEQKVYESLADNLTRPTNARGLSGHVSDFSYTVDRAQNIVTSSRLKTSVAIRPLGYAKTIDTDLFFSLNV